MDKSYLNQLKELVQKPKKNEPQVLNELFIDMPELHGLEGDERDKKMLRLAMIAELDAANLYEKMAHFTENEDIKEVMLDVAKEEKVHAGEFQALLEELDPEHAPALEDGEDEVDDLLGEGRQILREGKMEIVPKNGIGPIKLGMTFKQVKAAAPACNKTFKKTKDSVHLTLDCDKLNIHVFFDKNGIANQIEAFEGSGVTYKNYDFFKGSYKDAVSFLKRFGSAEKVGIHLWSDDGETLDSVLIKK